MTKDLALCVHGKDMEEKHWLDTESFMDEIEKVLIKKLKKEKHFLKSKI